MQYHQTNQAMNIPAEFDDIRPYNPDELQGICEELIADPDFRKAIESVMPGVPVEALAAQLKQCKTSLDIHRLLRCTDVLTAAAVNIKRNVFINIMQKKIVKKIKS